MFSRSFDVASGVPRFRAAAITFLACAGPGAAQAPSTARVSLTTSGSQATAPSHVLGEVAVSDLGLHVAFVTEDALDPVLDQNGVQDVYLREVQSGLTRLVSVGTLGLAGSGHSSDPSISANGRFVAFSSAATNLVTGDTNGVDDVFVRDLLLATTTLVSVAAGGGAANGASGTPSIDDLGQSVAFMSAAGNLPGGAGSTGSDIFLRNLAAQQTTLVSVGMSGAADGPAQDPALSADGQWIAYSSRATNVVPNDLNNEEDIFLWSRASLQTTRVSVSTTNSQVDRRANNPAVSGDGRFVVFHTASALLAPGDANNVEDVFLRDTQLQTTELISAPTPALASGSPTANSYSVVADVSSDGRFVAFVSGVSDFVNCDTNGVADVYLRDRLVNATRRLSVSSGGIQGNGPSMTPLIAPAISPDGRFTAFVSLASNLVSNDTNGVSDVFLHDDGAGPPWCWTYCTAKTNSLGCVPAIACSGTPSTNPAAGSFLLTAANIVANKFGLVFYGYCGNDAFPFNGGWLCVKSPILRGPIQSSGGAANTCTGTFSYDFNPLIQSGAQPLLSAGADVFAQYWYRDPASPSTTGLTDAAWFRIQP